MTTTAVITKTWTGRTGEVRHYVQNAGAIVQAMYDRDGYELPRRWREDADAASVWIDEAGEVHCPAYVANTSREDLAAEIKAGLAQTETEAVAAEAQVEASAEFAQAVLATAGAVVTGSTAEYDEVRSPIYGRGRRYRDMPGATQYRNPEGDYSVQIWDEA